MNYLELLAERGKTLVIQGPEGCGKSLLSDQLACSDVNTRINSTELYGRFTGWLADKPTVVIIEVEKHTTQSVLNKIKQFTSCDKIEVNLKGENPKLISTPFFILNVDCDVLDPSFSLSRHFVVINMGESL